MKLLDKFFKAKKEKDFGATRTEGGIELLRRLTGQDFSEKGMLERYSKSIYVFACINAIAQKTASIDFKFYQILNSAGDTKEIVTHPAVDLIYRPNPFQTKTEFLEITIINLKCTGQAFWYKVRNASGKIVEIWNLRPDMMRVVPDPVKFIKEYRFTKSDGAEVVFMPEEIIHLKYPHPLSPYAGLSPMVPAQGRIQTEEYAAQYQRDFFLNNARPDAVLKNAGKKMTEAQRKDLKDGWSKQHEGVGNNSKIAILDGGLEYQLIALTQKEMDYIESMKFTRDDILVAFHVPKPIVTVVEDVNRANSETAMFIFLSETIKPEVKRLVEKLNEQLIYPDFGEEYYLDFDDPTPQDKEYMLREDDTLVRANIRLINEARARRGDPPIRGGWSIYGSLVTVPIGGLSSLDTPAAKKLMDMIQKDSDANEKLLTEAKLSGKKYEFRGRYQLKQKFIMFEMMQKRLKDVENLELTLRKLPKKKMVKKKTWKPILQTPEMKAIYANLINKTIDSQSAKLKEDSNHFFEGQMHRVLGELAKRKSKTTAKKLDAAAILKYDKEVELSIKFIIPFIDKYLNDAGTAALAMLAPQEDFTASAIVQKKIVERAKFFAVSVNSTTLQKLDSTLAEGIAASEGIADLTDRVKEVYQDFPIYRSEMVARTEATNANNEGAVEGFRQSNIATGKEWINAGDNRVRDEHLDQSEGGVGGEIVPLDDVFSNGLEFPSEINCRCVVGPAFLE